jgi:hypothetical protein
VWETPRPGKRVALFSVVEEHPHPGQTYYVRRVMRLHLADLRVASDDASIDDGVLAQAADLYARHRDRIAGMKAAIVAGPVQAYTKAVAVERRLSRYGASVFVFNALDTACTWLGVNPDEVDRTLQGLRPGPGSRATGTSLGNHG